MLQRSWWQAVASAGIALSACLPATAAVRVQNGDFDRDLTGWSATAAQWASGPDSDGDPRSGVLRWSLTGDNVSGFVDVARSECLGFDPAAGPHRFTAAVRRAPQAVQGNVRGEVYLRFHASTDCSGNDYTDDRLLDASVPGRWSVESVDVVAPEVYPSDIPDQPPLPVRSVRFVLRASVSGARNPAIEFDGFDYGPVVPRPARAELVESFDDVDDGGGDPLFALADAGWVRRNLSAPLGSTMWAPGTPALFVAADGTAGSYLYSGFDAAAVGAGSVLSNWLLTPELQFAADRDCISFRTRQPAGSAIVDRAAVRLSTSGASIDVGNAATTSGVFTTLLTVLNRNYRSNPHGCPVGALQAGNELDAAYPDQWCELRICGLPDSGSGRIALRHSLNDTAVHGSAIAIDSVRFPSPAPLLPAIVSFPDLSETATAIGEPYRVRVRVAGIGDAPTGRVTIADGHDRCTATLGDGIGECVLRSRIAGDLQLVARYPGDLRHLAATAMAPHTVTGAGTEVPSVYFLNPTPATSYGDQPVDMHVAVQAGSDPRPSGQVVVDDGRARCTLQLDRAGIGRCTLRMQGAGPRTLTARYAGDGRFAPAQTTFAHTVAVGTGVATLSGIIAYPEPSLSGQPYRMSAQVGGAIVVDGRATVPAGIVRFSDDRSTCDARIEGGVARCFLDGRGASGTVTASYPGNRHFAAAQAGVAHTIVSRPGTQQASLLVSDTNDPSRVGQAFELRVQAGGDPAPTGVVVISTAGPQERCRLNLANGEDRCLLVAEQAGSMPLTVHYIGDPRYASSIVIEPHTVSDTRAATTTVIAAHMPATTPVGAPFVVDVQVAGGSSAATGAVVVDDGEAACEAILAGGTARCTLNARASGTAVLTARYGGDREHRPSSGTATHVVTVPTAPRTPVGIAIGSHAPNPSAPGQAYQVQASVIASDGGDPSGTVTISDGTASCTSSVIENGAGCSLVSATAGDKLLTASYGGDAQYEPGATTVTHRVVAPPTDAFRNGFE